MNVVTDDSLNFSGFSAVGQLPPNGRQLRLPFGDQEEAKCPVFHRVEEREVQQEKAKSRSMAMDSRLSLCISRPHTFGRHMTIPCKCG